MQASVILRALRLRVGLPGLQVRSPGQGDSDDHYSRLGIVIRSNLLAALQGRAAAVGPLESPAAAGPAAVTVAGSRRAAGVSHADLRH